MRQVRKFVAPTLWEVMGQVKRELGPEAMIVSTRPVRVGGFLGFFGTRMIEVTATAEDVRRRPPGERSAGRASLGRSVTPVSRAALAYQADRPATADPLPTAPETESAATAAQPAAAAAQPAAWQELRQEMGQVKHLLDRLLAQRTSMAQVLESMGPEAQQLFDGLVNIGVSSENAFQLVHAVLQERRQPSGGAGLDDALLAAVAQAYPSAGAIELAPGSCRRVALIGPTGVGKTTTLAKLAAHFALEQRRKVAVVTADTFRIAAAEQLRVYADIIGVPFWVVNHVDEVAEVVDALADYDLVLFDTAGRSHRDDKVMAELKDLLAAIAPHETHLVLSLTADSRDIMVVATAYAPLGFNRILFTKLDETSRPGLVFNVLAQWGIPASYITTGQRVPDDIELAAAERIGRILMEG